MKVSKQGYDLAKAHEGYSDKAYRCPAGVPTIGFGHTKGVKLGDRCTAAQASQWLTEDMAEAESGVNALNLTLNQNQFDALADFAFNLGIGKLKGSTLLKRVRANPNDPTIGKEFEKWVYGGGNILPGLVRRRQDEEKLYFSR